jgi:hypothetical protein
VARIAGRQSRLSYRTVVACVMHHDNSRPP